MTNLYLHKGKKDHFPAVETSKFIPDSDSPTLTARWFDPDPLLDEDVSRLQALFHKYYGDL